MEIKIGMGYTSILYWMAFDGWLASWLPSYNAFSPDCEGFWEWVVCRGGGKRRRISLGLSRECKKWKGK